MKNIKHTFWFFIVKSYTISSDLNVFAIALVSHIVLATPQAFLSYRGTRFSIPFSQQSMSCVASHCDHLQTCGRQSFASDVHIIFVQWQISTIFSRSVNVLPLRNHIHNFFLTDLRILDQWICPIWTFSKWVREILKKKVLWLFYCNKFSLFSRVLWVIWILHSVDVHLTLIILQWS